MIQPDIRFDPDVTFGEMCVLVLQEVDHLKDLLNDSVLSENISQLRKDIVLLKNLHYGKTEIPSDV